MRHRPARFAPASDRAASRRGRERAVPAVARPLERTPRRRLRALVRRGAPLRSVHRCGRQGIHPLFDTRRGLHLVRPRPAPASRRRAIAGAALARERRGAALSRDRDVAHCQRSGRPRARASHRSRRSLACGHTEDGSVRGGGAATAARCALLARVARRAAAAPRHRASAAPTHRHGAKGPRRHRRRPCFARTAPRHCPRAPSYRPGAASPARCAPS